MDKRGVQKVKKVYFACSIAGGRDHAHLYEDIVKQIQAAGAQVLSERFTDEKKVKDEAAKAHAMLDFIHDRDLAWVKEADGIIAEVTQPSLGVGYELGKATEWKKPVLALFFTPSGNRLSPMIAGSKDIQVVHYKTHTELEQDIKDFVQSL